MARGTDYASAHCSGTQATLIMFRRALSTYSKFAEQLMIEH